MNEQTFNNLAGKIGDIADSVSTGFRDITEQFQASLEVTNIFLGTISISLIALVVLKFWELKKDSKNKKDS